MINIVSIFPAYSQLSTLLHIFNLHKNFGIKGKFLNYINQREFHLGFLNMEM